mmetsp:Transcript_58050/g.69208  ORF Transcript_58050/g.69208 Transcript_58050/m.69208 type:complete len:86 (+) Transcript_58050:187-444(+)
MNALTEVAMERVVVAVGECGSIVSGTMAMCGRHCNVRITLVLSSSSSSSFGDDNEWVGRAMPIRYYYRPLFSVVISVNATSLDVK